MFLWEFLFFLQEINEEISWKKQFKRNTESYIRVNFFVVLISGQKSERKVSLSLRSEASDLFGKLCFLSYFLVCTSTLVILGVCRILGNGKWLERICCVYYWVFIWHKTPEWFIIFCGDSLSFPLVFNMCMELSIHLLIPYCMERKLT